MIVAKGYIKKKDDSGALFLKVAAIAAPPPRRDVTFAISCKSFKKPIVLPSLFLSGIAFRSAF